MFPERTAKPGFTLHVNRMRVAIAREALSIRYEVLKDDTDTSQGRRYRRWELRRGHTPRDPSLDPGFTKLTTTSPSSGARSNVTHVNHVRPTKRQVGL